MDATLRPPFSAFCAAAAAAAALPFALPGMRTRPPGVVTAVTGAGTAGKGCPAAVVVATVRPGTVSLVRLLLPRLSVFCIARSSMRSPSTWACRVRMVRSALSPLLHVVKLQVAMDAGLGKGWWG